VTGPTGGYEPVVNLDGLSVLEIVEAIDGPTDTGRCVVADRPCDATEPCVLHVAWGRARRELVASLAGLSLTAVTATA
jgi:DNA-binding IscR family transcriptional regulator